MLVTAPLQFGQIATNAYESRHPNLWRSLVGAWVPALGMQGNRLIDVSGRKRNGTINGDPHWVWTPIGAGLEFDGTDDYVGVTALGNFGSQMATDFSIAFWFNSTSADQSRIAGTVNDDDTILQFIYSRETAGDLGFYLRGSSSSSDFIWVQTNVGFGDGAWHHVVMRKNSNSASGLSIYVDGKDEDVTVEVDNNFSNPTDFENPLVFGARNLRGNIDQFWNGLIGSVHIYSRALTPSEIRQLYLDPLAPWRLADDVALWAAASAQAPAGIPFPVLSASNVGM